MTRRTGIAAVATVGALNVAAWSIILAGPAGASTPKPLPAPYSWAHVPAKVASELHISPKSIEIFTNDTLVIVTPRGRVFTS